MHQKGFSNCSSSGRRRLAASSRQGANLALHLSHGLLGQPWGSVIIICNRGAGKLHKDGSGGNEADYATKYSLENVGRKLHSKLVLRSTYTEDQKITKDNLEISRSDISKEEAGADSPGAPLLINFGRC